jgi:hypothetical protein
VCLASFLDLPGLVRQRKVLAQCQKEGRVLIRGHHPIAGLAERPIQAQSAYSRVAGWGRLAHAKLAAIRPAAARMVAEEMRVEVAVGLMSAEAAMPSSRPSAAGSGAGAASILAMPPSKPFAAASDGMLVGAGVVHGNCRSKFGKSGGGVTQGDAGMFWRESGLEDGKNGGCQAIAPARLAGMSAQ